MTGPEHGKEFEPIYNDAQTNLRLNLPKWETGMIKDTAAFKKIVEELGGKCTIGYEFVKKFRKDEIASEMLTRREKVQEALLYPPQIQEKKTEFRNEMLRLLNNIKNPGETIHIVRITIQK